MSHPSTRRPARRRGPAQVLCGRMAGWWLALGLALAAALTGMPVAAQAATPTVTVTMGAVSPASVTTSPTSGQRLTITGTLANTSGQNLTQVQVYLWRDTSPITSAAALKRYLGSDQTVPTGRRAVDSERGTYASITSDTQPTFVPGQSASFTTSAEVALLGFTSPGVYPIGVQVRAVRPGSSVPVTVGRARTMLSVQASGAAKLTFSPLVELTSKPSLVSATTFSDNHLATELTGRLDRLMTQAEKSGSTVLVDPGLVDEVTALKSAHTVVGTTLTSSQQSAQRRAATKWLARLTTVLASHQAYRLPYGNADLALALATGDAATRDRVAAAPQSTNPVAKLSLAVVASTGTTSEALLQFVQPLKPAVVFTRDVGDGRDPATGLELRSLATNVLTGGPAPAPLATSVQLRSLVLADALLAQLARGSTIVLPVSTDADLGVATSAESAATATRVTATATGDPRVPTTASVPAATAWSSATGPMLDTLTTWGDLTSQQDEATVLADQAIARSMSASWDNTAQGIAYLSAVSAQVGDPSRTVTVSMTREFVLSSNSNMLPATVTNTLDHSVRVKLTFSSENPQRIRVPDTTVVTVGPGDHATVHFSPVAATNGAVTVLAQLRTPEGRAIGAPIRITIRATSFGRVGWIIVVASGVTFMGLTTLRIRQVQRERAQVRATRHAAAVRAVRLAETPPSGQTGGKPGAVPGEAGGDASGSDT